MNQKRLTHTSPHLSSAFSLSVHVDAVSVRFRKSERKMYTHFLLNILITLIVRQTHVLTRPAIAYFPKKSTHSILLNPISFIHTHQSPHSKLCRKTATLKNITGNIAKRHASLFERFNFSFNIGE